MFSGTGRDGAAGTPAGGVSRLAAVLAAAAAVSAWSSERVPPASVPDDRDARIVSSFDTRSAIVVCSARTSRKPSPTSRRSA